MAGDARGAKAVVLSILVFKGIDFTNYACVKEIVFEMYISKHKVD
jgi:hypothetical protein